MSISIESLIGGSLVHNHTLSKAGDFVCPQCLEKGNYNSSYYQMNDIVETVFCSLECSSNFTNKYKAEILELGWTEREIEEAI